MATALVKSTDAESRALRDEIDIWLEGRSYASQEEYVPAKIAYGLAIRLNDNNPATYLERALTSQRIADYEEAISDLTAVWERGAAWEEIVLEIVNSDTQLQDALWVQDELPPFSPFVPTATPSVTLVATQLPTETPKPSLTLTLIPQETPSPSLTATSTPTSTPSSTPSPTNTPVDTKTPVPLRITGLPSGELKNPFVFTWSGPASTRYRVVLRQLTEGYTHTSNWLSKFEWTFDIPGEQFGAWEWYVESETGVNSSRSEFFFNPHTGSGNSGSESGGYPGPKPTSVPKPTSPYTGP
jgi:hypothetical protein